MATTSALARINRYIDKEKGAQQLATSPVGQVIGIIKQERSCKQIVQDFKEDFVLAIEEMDRLV
jgi:hypothetical protein